MDNTIKVNIDYTVRPTDPRPYQLKVNIQIDKNLKEIIIKKYKYNSRTYINFMPPFIWVSYSEFDLDSIDVLESLNEEITICYDNKKVANWVLKKVSIIEKKLNRFFKHEINTYYEAQEEYKQLKLIQ